MQVVIDSKTKGWYVVPGIPTAARTALDPLDRQFDPSDPCKPFCLGECLLEELNTPQRFVAMRAKLNKALEDVKEQGEAVRTKVSKEYLSYVEEVAQHILVDDAMHDAVIRSIGSSDKAMSNLAKSEEAMSKLAQSDEAMRKILGPEMFEVWKAYQRKRGE
jgi:hypothetical protein